MRRGSRTAVRTLVSTYQLAITAGIVLSYLTGLVLGGEDTWRVMFALGAVPGLAFLLGLVFLPESPRWLVLKGRPAEDTPPEPPPRKRVAN